MSLIFRRGLSTLIPPKVASPSGIGAAKDAKRMQRLVGFYGKLPKGAPPAQSGGGPIAWYRRTYFGDNASAAPLAHLIGLFLLTGYVSEYYFHLRHHKNNAH